MYQERSVIHFNVADFAVAVERVVDSSLRQRPVVIAPLQAARAVVYDMSEEAFQSGVRKGMQLYQATRLCRQAVVLPPRFDLYQRAMQSFFKKVRLFSPLIEHGLADGHLFVDVTGTHRLFGPPPDIGWKVRKDVCGDLGVDPIWTLSSSKLVAKVASRLVKPVGEYIVAAGEEEEFFAPLSVSLLPGVSKSEMRKLHEFNITKIGQLAGLSRSELAVPFGRRSDFFYEVSHGVDRDAVMSGPRETAPVCSEHHFADDTNDRHQVKIVVNDLADRIGMELRRRKQAARRVGLKIIYSDGSAAARQASRRTGSSSDFVLRDMALLALQRAWTRRTRLRSCYLTCDRLHRQSPQLQLFSAMPEKKREQEKILAAMDVIRSRFGNELIKVGGQQLHQAG
jgi:DNA polymerase-4